MRLIFILSVSLLAGCYTVPRDYLVQDETYWAAMKPVVDAYTQPDRQTYVDLYESQGQMIAKALHPTTQP